MKDDEEPKRGRGNPPFVPTPEQRLMVQILASNRTPQDVIARNRHRQKGDNGISEMTLRKAFRHELDCGYADTLARVGSTVVREALKGQGLGCEVLAHDSRRCGVEAYRERPLRPDA
jgi:hypothetical protein